MRNIMLAGFVGSMLVAAQAAMAAPPTITVYVSCFRGPWTQVIWDRPNPIFIDSLMQAGYTLETAQAIGERVCRDPNLVNNPDATLAEARRLIADVPRKGKPVLN